MSRAGRPRKQRGYLVEKRALTSETDAERALRLDLERVGNQPHRRGLPEGLRLSEKAATPLGALNLMGTISDEQHEAGRLFGIAVHEYRQSIGCPDAGWRGARGSPCAPEACRLDPDRCECLARKTRFNLASKALLDVGHRAAVAVQRVAVQEKGCPYGYLWWLKAGLDALAKHFGLHGRRKAA